MNNSSRLSATARCMNSNVRPTIYLEKHYPIEGRQDFFKWVVVTPEGFARDYKNEVMYFDDFNIDQAKRVVKSLRAVSKL